MWSATAACLKTTTNKLYMFYCNLTKMFQHIILHISYVQTQCIGSIDIIHLYSKCSKSLNSSKTSPTFLFMVRGILVMTSLFLFQFIKLMAKIWCLNSRNAPIHGFPVIKFLQRTKDKSTRNINICTKKVSLNVHMLFFCAKKPSNCERLKTHKSHVLLWANFKGPYGGPGTDPDNKNTVIWQYIFFSV